MRDIRKQIIDSAREIFARFGFKKTTMDEIAESLHKGKSSIYHYFKSKEEIFKEVIKQEYSLLKNNVNKALAKVESPQEKLRIYIITRLKLLFNLSNFYSALMDSYFECLDLIEAIRIEYTLEEIKTVEGILKEGGNQGIFIEMNQKDTAQMIISVVKALEFEWARSQDQQALQDNINNMLDLFFYGIMKR